MRVCPCAMMPDEPFMPARCETQEKGWCNYTHYANSDYYGKCRFNKKQTVKEGDSQMKCSYYVGGSWIWCPARKTFKTCVGCPWSEEE